jgi:hypothetical protein
MTNRSKSRAKGPTRVPFATALRAVFPHAEIEPGAFDNAFTGTDETNWLFLALNDSRIAPAVRVCSCFAHTRLSRMIESLRFAATPTSLSNGFGVVNKRKAQSIWYLRAWIDLACVCEGRWIPGTTSIENGPPKPKGEGAGARVNDPRRRPA